MALGIENINVLHNHNFSRNNNLTNKTRLIAVSAGAATGTFLVLTINGTPYKLPLFNI